MSKPSNKNTSSYQDFHIDWKSLFSPCPVDIEAQTPEQVKFARRYNLFFLAFNAIAHSVRVKKRAGRKELAPVASFKECFSNQEFYQTVDRFITANHDETKPMCSVECRANLRREPESPFQALDQGISSFTGKCPQKAKT